ncbi:hypothetical protein J6W34_08810 [bacterium]|nr:hypothetical protein [bacterium]
MSSTKNKFVNILGTYTITGFNDNNEATNTLKQNIMNVMKYELSYTFTQIIYYGHNSSIINGNDNFTESYGIYLSTNLSINQAFSNTNNLTILKNDLISSLINDINGQSSNTYDGINVEFDPNNTTNILEVDGIYFNVNTLFDDFISFNGISNPNTILLNNILDHPNTYIDPNLNIYFNFAGDFEIISPYNLSSELNSSEQHIYNPSNT